ncbi:MAG: HAD domain-containing protein, partial [Beduini sp.]
MKIIILDIDGVLNCEYCKIKIDGVHFVMDEKIILLKQLVDRTGAKIVLSSTWRYGWVYM